MIQLMQEMRDETQNQSNCRIVGVQGGNQVPIYLQLLDG